MSCEVVLCDYHGDLLLLVGRVVYHPAPLPGDVHGDGLPPVLAVEVLLAPPLQVPGNSLTWIGLQPSSGV